MNPLKKKINGYRQEIIDILCDLIEIPTVNPPGHKYRTCIDYISSRLSDWGIDHNIIKAPNGDYPRYSILGEFGEGNDSIHLHGHYDVVPAFTSDQLKAVIQGEKVYGRGTADMKSGLLVIMYVLRVIKELKSDLEGKIYFSIVPDEETGGFKGTQYLIRTGKLPHATIGMLMPEPTSGIIWNANKGALTYRITIDGKPKHVALINKDKNAFEIMVDVANDLQSLKNKIIKRKTNFAVHPPEAKYSKMLLGGYSGSGQSFNVSPNKAFFTIDRRYNPEENINEVKKEIMDILKIHSKKGFDIKIEVMQEGEPSVSDPESSLVLCLRESIESVTGFVPDTELCPGLCEIRFFNSIQIPAYAYGPGLLEVSHGPNEYVNSSEIIKCIMVYVLTIIKILRDNA